MRILIFQRSCRGKKRKKVNPNTRPEIQVFIMRHWRSLWGINFEGNVWRTIHRD